MSDLNFQQINRNQWKAASGELFYVIDHEQTLRSSMFHLIVSHRRSSHSASDSFYRPTECWSTHKSLELAMKRANELQIEQVQR